MLRTSRSESFYQYITPNLIDVFNAACHVNTQINGAGKTTTMAMLTAEFPPSSGDAILAGFSVSNEPEQTRRTIGYCPQFDAHFMNMTGREHVELYAVIKGVPKERIKEAVAAKLAEVGLSEHDSNRLSQEYSGGESVNNNHFDVTSLSADINFLFMLLPKGMKRKLSVACATIGQPQIVFLDEPRSVFQTVSGILTIALVLQTFYSVTFLCLALGWIR